MSRCALTSYVYGLYLLPLGVLLVFIPEPITGLAGIPIADPYWPRTTGLLSCVVGFYSVQAARLEVFELIVLSIHGRTAAFVFFTAVVLIGIAPPIVFLLGLIDLATAIWTYWEASKDPRFKPVLQLTSAASAAPRQDE